MRMELNSRRKRRTDDDDEANAKDDLNDSDHDDRRSKDDEDYHQDNHSIVFIDSSSTCSSPSPSSRDSTISSSSISTDHEPIRAFKRKKERKSAKQAMKKMKLAKIQLRTQKEDLGIDDDEIKHRFPRKRGRPRLNLRTNIKPISYDEDRYFKTNGISDPPDLNDTIPKPIDDIETKAKKSPNKSSYFCIFCDEKLADHDTAFDHIANHMDYYHYCHSCSRHFKTADRFFDHGCINIGINHMLHKYNVNIATCNWIDNFLGFQKSNELFILEDKLACDYCCVCRAIYGETKKIDFNEYKDISIEKYNEITKHVRSHLQYHSYECKLCLLEKRRFLVYSNEIKPDGHIHSSNEHTLTIINSEVLKNFFVKNTVIMKLEELLLPPVISDSNQMSPLKPSSVCSSSPASQSN